MYFEKCLFSLESDHLQTKPKEKKVWTWEMTLQDFALQLLVTSLTLDQGLRFSYKLYFVEVGEYHCIPHLLILQYEIDTAPYWQKTLESSIFTYS